MTKAHEDARTSEDSDQRRVDALRGGLAGALKEAMAARDALATRALRAALGALDNATAIEETAAHVETFGRSSDVPRRVVSYAECREILEREVEEREAAAKQYDGLGRAAESERLRAEAAIIGGFLAG